MSKGKWSPTKDRAIKNIQRTQGFIRLLIKRGIASEDVGQLVLSHLNGLLTSLRGLETIDPPKPPPLEPGLIFTPVKAFQCGPMMWDNPVECKVINVLGNWVTLEIEGKRYTVHRKYL